MSVWVRPRQVPDPEVVVFYFGERAAENESGAVLQGRFKLLEPIAWGGTAAVYKARNLETKGLCAVKVLYPGARGQVASFFGQEGRLATRIRSPHLVRANAFGEDAGRPFIVFDYVQGQALAGLYFMQLMPWRELLRVVLQVLDALAALHRRGIVHRDVKPDNVIVEEKLGGEIHVTLLDLGFAAVPPERRLTGAPMPAREVYGTAGFIAPELLAGCPPEPRNDLYSVGAMMYMKLTAQAVPDISADPERMEIPSPRAFVPSLPFGVDDVVMRALSDIEARFQSAEEMVTAIREVLEAEDRAALREAIEAEDRAAGVAVPDMSRQPGQLPPVAAASPEPASIPGAAPSAATRAVDGQATMEARATGYERGSRRLVAALLLGAFVGGATVHVARGTDSPEASGEPAHLEPATGRGVEQNRPNERQLRTPAPSAPGGAALAPTVPVSLAFPEPPKTPSPTPTAPRKVPGARTNPGRSFEKVMNDLAGKARQCARDAGLAEDPIEVQVLGEGPSISTVRVVHLGGRHPFTRCIEPAIRAAAPPLGGEPIRQYTFFSEKR